MSVTRTEVKYKNVLLQSTEKDKVEDANGTEVKDKGRTTSFKPKIVYRNVVLFIYMHLALLYAIYLIITVRPGKTILFSVLCGISCTGYGIAAGAHRLWAHNAYKAKFPLKVILMFFQTLAGQNSIYVWARDHRVHHKFSDTDADPHSISRGFFFAHMGWLMMEKHPDVRVRGGTVDVSDLDNDPVVQFQKKHYIVLYFLISIIAPVIIPMYFWGETFSNAWHISVIFRYAVSLHITWCLNSVAHTYGHKPYDKNIKSTEATWMGLIGIGEGWHNFHHTFPWDYRNSELGHKELTYINNFIDFFALFGWAYDLKTVSQDMIRKRALRTGDGSHRFAKEKTDMNGNAVDSESDVLIEKQQKVLWGWNDLEMTDLDKTAADIHYGKKRD